MLQGILGFYKGISASYMGISETVIHFVIYEAIKTHLVAKRMQRLGLDESLLDTAPRETRDFVEFMIAAAISKTIASCAAYPHGKTLRVAYQNWARQKSYILASSDELDLNSPS